MVPRPGETGGEWWSVTGQAGGPGRAHAARDGLTDDPEDMTAAFFHDVPADVAAAAQAQPFAQSERPFADPWPLHPLARRPHPGRGRAGRPVLPRRLPAEVAAERLGLEVDEVPGGHLVALSRPVELADRLEAYLGSR